MIYIPYIGALFCPFVFLLLLILIKLNLFNIIFSCLKQFFLSKTSKKILNNILENLKEYQ